MTYILDSTFGKVRSDVLRNHTLFEMLQSPLGFLVFDFLFYLFITITTIIIIIWPPLKMHIKDGISQIKKNVPRSCRDYLQILLDKIMSFQSMTKIMQDLTYCYKICTMIHLVCSSHKNTQDHRKIVPDLKHLLALSVQARGWR